MKLKNFRLTILILILQIILAIYLGSGLPEDARVPSHWNIKGEIDGWTNKSTAIYLFPIMNLCLFGLMFFFPRFSPRYRRNAERFNHLLPSLTMILILFFALIHIYSLLLARELIADSTNFILVLIGLLFIFLGNLLPKVPSNFFVGVRLPWTLSSETVWRKTHRLAGWSFSLGGLILIVCGLLGKITMIIQIMLILSFVFIVIVPVIYAFIMFKKEGN